MTVRVVSGSAKGRPLKSVPGSGTRPTTDKVKEAVFSMIGPYFEGGAVLDLFAGTGGLGIEALSRGMESAVFVDMEPKSIDTIRANLKATNLEQERRKCTEMKQEERSVRWRSGDVFLI